MWLTYTDNFLPETGSRRTRQPLPAWDSICTWLIRRTKVKLGKQRGTNKIIEISHDGGAGYAGATPVLFVYWVNASELGKTNLKGKARMKTTYK